MTYRTAFIQDGFDLTKIVNRTSGDLDCDGFRRYLGTTTEEDKQEETEQGDIFHDIFRRGQPVTLGCFRVSIDLK